MPHSNTFNLESSEIRANKAKSQRKQLLRELGKRASVKPSEKACRTYGDMVGDRKVSHRHVSIA